MDPKFIKNYFDKINILVKSLDLQKIDKIVTYLQNLKKRKGRLFILGVGGSASNASHAVNDFRKICEIECYSMYKQS